MARFFRSVVWREDPLRLLARIPVALYSAWVRAIYPFAAIGRHVEIHYTWDFRRYLAHRVKLGNSVFIGKDVHFGIYCLNEEKGKPMIVVEDGCGIHRNTQISARNCIYIERDVIMGPAALIMDHNHEFKDVTLPIKRSGHYARRNHPGSSKDAGLAAAQPLFAIRRIVLGRNSVVHANALVTKSCPPYSVLVGNPARIATQFDPIKGIWMGLPGRAPRPDGEKKQINATCYERRRVANRLPGKCRRQNG